MNTLWAVALAPFFGGGGGNAFPWRPTNFVSHRYNLRPAASPRDNRNGSRRSAGKDQGRARGPFGGGPTGFRDTGVRMHDMDRSIDFCTRVLRRRGPRTGRRGGPGSGRVLAMGS